MTTPTNPDALPENDEPLFDEVVEELGYNPAHPEEAPADSTDGGPEDPDPSGT
ncbi:hypothetical protein [Nocardioides sp. HB32]|jgi:hypothetical protein